MNNFLNIISSLYNSSVVFLQQENHPDLPLIQSKQNEVNAAWERLRGLALQRQKALSNAADLQRFKRYGSGHCFTENFEVLYKNRVFVLGSFYFC